MRRAAQFLAAVALLATSVRGAESNSIARPSYFFGAPIPIECMNRSSYVLPCRIFTLA